MTADDTDRDRLWRLFRSVGWLSRQWDEYMVAGHSLGPCDDDEEVTVEVDFGQGGVAVAATLTHPAFTSPREIDGDDILRQVEEWVRLYGVVS